MRYLKLFFKEKQLPSVTWDLQVDGVAHTISNESVIEAILAAPKSEQKAIGDVIRRLDFLNKDVNAYLKHLAVPLCKAANVRFGFASEGA